MGRLYGRERFQPGRICGQIWLLQVSWRTRQRVQPSLVVMTSVDGMLLTEAPTPAVQVLFYTIYVIAAFTGATLVGIPWSFVMIIHPDYFTGWFDVVAVQPHARGSELQTLLSCSKFRQFRVAGVR